MIAIIDYDTGNLRSIANMLKRAGADSVITRNREDIERAEKLILPGVGSFDPGMEKLRSLELLDTIEKRVVEDRIPVLGICLGMQLMTRKSAEGALPGLGWIDAEVKPFLPAIQSLKVPHMGWNHVEASKNSSVVEDLPNDPKFYFLHSYYVENHRPEDVLLKSTYGISFSAAFEKNNIVGMQFHPEKSHKYGLKILENFANRFPLS